LFVPYFVLQFGIGAFLPIAILAFLIFGKARGQTLIVGAIVSALLVLMSVFMMRWNMVIGGQMISKTLKGLLSNIPPLFGRESLLAALFVMAAPFGLLRVLTRLFRRRTVAPIRQATDARHRHGGAWAGRMIARSGGAECAVQVKIRRGGKSIRGHGNVRTFRWLHGQYLNWRD
jgi:hypothetical protein